jgi:acetyltransferase-like isoleucine patch superfamily enzyme
MRKSEIKIVGVTTGKDVHVVEPVNLYDCNLASGVFVGPFVEIQSDVNIGARTKIQSHTFICSLVEIGSDCFIGHGVMFVNDKFSTGTPACGDESLWQNTKIGQRVLIGSNATLLPVEICDDVVIGAGAVVTKDICEPGKYVGNPARKID